MTANRISQLRAAKGMTQTELAAKIGATLSMVGKLERGERGITGKWLERISEALGCTQADIVGSGWLPISTAPTDGTWFLGFWPVHCLQDRVCATRWDGVFVDADDFRDWLQPTHWMPLPAEPEVAPVDGSALPGGGE